MTTGHLVVGPSEHGVVRCAVEIFAALVARGVPSRLARARTMDDAPAALVELAGHCRVVHIHFTDKLFGTSASQAAVHFQELAEVAASRGVRLSVTLHDVPQRSDGAAWPQRIACYQAVAGLSVSVVVSSRHERRLLLDVERVAVVPLMIPELSHTVSQPAESSRPRDVAILGFLYPGKGHMEVMNALSDVSADVGFLAVGAPSRGHEYLTDDLLLAAERSGRRCGITGFIPDDKLVHVLQQVAVPIAHHRHMSASASINTWISARRRPLVCRNDYTDEFDARSPGTLWLYQDNDAGLRGALRDAVAHPDRTWLDASVVPTPDADLVAAQYAAIFAQWS